MTTTLDELTTPAELDARLRIILPPEYQDSYERVEPTPMRSAGLKYGPDGLVAWNEMWDSFCDLAMAGGPPHKGALLEPPSRAEIDAHPDRLEEVVDEICRGVTMATDLQVGRSPRPGWIRITCYSDAMAGWMLRAIAMENVSVRADGLALDLPAGPAFRLDREIKNVVTVAAKTSHYWLGHIPREQKSSIAILFASLTNTLPLIEPAWFADDTAAMPDSMKVSAIATQVRERTGFLRSDHRYGGWLGLGCPDVRSAIWLMRALVVTNVLARREGSVLFVPINPVTDPDGERVVSTLVRINQARG